MLASSNTPKIHPVISGERSRCQTMRGNAAFLKLNVKLIHYIYPRDRSVRYLYKYPRALPIRCLAMQPPLSTKPQPEPENKYPDCLYMELEGIPVRHGNQEHLEFWSTSTPKQQIALHLTINFNEQWESLNNGRVKFGLKGGELRLKLENGEIPYKYRELVGSIELYIPQEGQELKGSQVQKGIRVRSPATQFSLNGNKTQAQVTVSTEQELARTEASVTVCHVTTKLSEEHPVWIFEEEIGEPILKGLLNKVKLATLNVLAFPCRVEATFEVSKRDVCLTDAEGLWSPDISRNKRAVLDRLIVQRLLEPKLKPYLSRVELHYD